MLPFVSIGVSAQTYIYSTITGSFSATTIGTNSVSGTGSWANSTVLPNFSYTATTSSNRIWQLSNTLGGAADEVNAINAWETKYGNIDANTTNCIKIRSDWNQSFSGQPLKPSINTVVTFTTVTQPGNWGFMVLDIDVDQVRIRAKDPLGAYYPNSVINSWLKGTMDMSTNTGNTTPCWDAANATVVGREYPCVRQAVLNPVLETEGAAAWFEPNVPVSTIEFVFDNLQPTTGSPSQRYFIAAARTYTVSGNVFSDPNAGFVNNSSGAANTVPSGMYANLVGADGNVVAVSVVATNGTYSFPSPGGAHTVVLSTTAGTPGSPAPAASVPSGWVNTGEHNGAPNTGNTAPVDGISAVFTVSTADINNINFGIQQPPTADPKSYSILESDFSATPPLGFSSLTGYKSIPMSSAALTGYSTGGSLSGSDPEDCAAAGSCNTGTGTTFNIETINVNTKLYYDFGGATGVQEIDVSGGSVTIDNFDASKLVIYGQIGSGVGSNSIGFTYSITDGAGAVSTPVSYQINTDVALPVKLIYFDAYKKGNTTEMKWATASEQNSRGFEVQRSANGRGWSSVVFVNSKAEEGNSKYNIHYTFTDNNPANGENFYRLKQTDFDGKNEYSPVIMVGFDKENSISIYPNPANESVNITGLQGGESIKLYDITGRIVDQSKVENVSVTIPLDRLSEGIYYIRIIDADGYVSSHKVVKSK